MAQVTVTIAGRPYRMACGDGEEPHIEALGRLLNGKIDEMRGSFGEIGDQRMTVMAALTLADELLDARRRIGELEADGKALRTAMAAAETIGENLADRVADGIADAAQRIEDIAQVLNAATARGPWDAEVA